MAQSRNDFVTAFHFSVSFIWNGMALELPFSSVSGINAALQTEDLIEGGENRFAYKLPKSMKYDNLKLTRAIRSGSSAAAEKALVLWAEDALHNFKISPRTILVSLLNKDHVPVKSWSFVGAYPVSIKVNDLNASKDEVAIESLEFAYKYFTSVVL